MIKYLGIAPRHILLQDGVAATEQLSQKSFARSVAQLDSEQAQQLVAPLMQGDLKGWSGPAAGLLYFVLRNDAVDVICGVEEGFTGLGVPYMPHIAPRSRWGS